MAGRAEAGLEALRHGPVVRGAFWSDLGHERRPFERRGRASADAETRRSPSTPPPGWGLRNGGRPSAVFQDGRGVRLDRGARVPSRTSAGVRGNFFPLDAESESAYKAARFRRRDGSVFEIRIARAN